jgi:hypothetical protein
MHNKFWIFCDGETVVQDMYRLRKLQPVAVWTGSFNATKTGGRSFENAVIIRDRRVATAYAHEWAQIFALSEPLDWTTPWCEPEYRIGS